MAKEQELPHVDLTKQSGDCPVGASALTKQSGASALTKRGGEMVKLHMESAFWSTCTPVEKDMVKVMMDNDQAHVFGYWSAPDNVADGPKKRAFLQQLARLNHVHPLAEYYKRALVLLKHAKDGVNPFDGYEPSVPRGQSLDLNETHDEFEQFEALGVKEANATAFVLVAGGLGERLNYPGIKVGLPSEITTGKSYLQLYIEHILALQSLCASGMSATEKSCKIPFVIMTSPDTDTATRKLLDDHKNFGMDKDQLTIVKQENVPALSDNAAHFVVLPDAPYTLQTKPHGHGDVHNLLYQARIVQQWKDEGRKWIVFFQDTNALVFRAIPAALGVSASRDMSVNSLAVFRKPGEAIGSIVHLKPKNPKGDTKTNGMILNVEYNQFTSLVKHDPVTRDGYSHYPGNMGALVVKIHDYLPVLKKTSGIISEFVNPKYKDASKTTFKKDTRLECLMQDYPKLLDPNAAIVGFTEFNRWFAFSPLKNSVAEALVKQNANLPTESAASAEADLYDANRLILSLCCGVNIQTSVVQHSFAGVLTTVGARVVWSPSWASTLAEIKTKIPNGQAVSISSRSTLVIEGRDIVIKSLKLDGALVIRAPEGKKIVIENLEVNNKGWEFVATKGSTIDPVSEIRGYTLKKNDTHYIDS